jgi:hypothetical protein
MRATERLPYLVASAIALAFRRQARTATEFRDAIASQRETVEGTLVAAGMKKT